jgi:hypothetical protein
VKKIEFQFLAECKVAREQNTPLSEMAIGMVATGMGFFLI